MKVGLTNYAAAYATGLLLARRLLTKLKLGRCDYALEELEYVIGGRNYESAWLDETGIASFRPTWARAPSVHFLVGKSRPDGEELVGRLNAAISSNAKSGFSKALQARYFQSTAKSGTKQ